MKNVKKEQEEGERSHGEAVKIIRGIDLVTNIEYPKSATKISENLDCIIKPQTHQRILHPKYGTEKGPPSITQL